MKKIIMVTPHLSTGGLPQYTLRMIERMRGDYEVWCVEWDNITGGVLVVQRNKIQEILSGDRLITLGEDKYEFLRLIDSVDPDIIHFQEVPETFIVTDILDAVYYKDRLYDVVVTTHSSYTDPSKIKYGADRFVLVSDWSRQRFTEHFGDDICQVWEYPTTPQIYDKVSAKDTLGFDKSKVHVLHVGLFTPGKNQAQVFEMARKIENNKSIHFHFVGNQADNFREYWEPLMSTVPSNCTWHGEKSNVEDFYKASDIFIFPSLFELNPLSLMEARNFGLPLVMKRLDTYMGSYDGVAHYIDSDVDRSIVELMCCVSELPNKGGQIYDSISRNVEVVVVTEPNIHVSFIDGPKVTITDAPGDVFDVSFIDNSTGVVRYVAEVGNGCWAKSNTRYAVDWTIRCVRRSDGKVFDNRFNPSGKRVFIAFESKSIGDTLAWFPQVDRFRERWECDVVCSTFWNEELVENYPEIELVHPGSVVDNLYAMFVVGWFWDGDGPSLQFHPKDFKTLPLAQTCSDILGLDYVQTKTRLNVPQTEVRKRVGLGIHSTAQTKYWNNPTGWQELTNFFIMMGYEVVVLSNEGDGYMGNKHPEGASMLQPGDFSTLKSAMASCEIFVGIGSGLSWLAWTLGVPTVLISGFSRPESEFEGEDVIRIFNDSVCNGCYNRYRFNAGDWSWCPDHKGTERQFECTKSISANMVISKIIRSGWMKF